MRPSGRLGPVPLAAACVVAVFLGRPDERCRDGLTQVAPLPVDDRVRCADGVAVKQLGGFFVAVWDFAPFEVGEFWVVPAYVAAVCHETKPRLLDDARA